MMPGTKVRKFVELTGLFHKEFFFEYGRLFDEQNENLLMDAVVIDINRFHLVNELYGRDFGDHVLKTLGKSIHEFVNLNGGLACRSDSNCFFYISLIRMGSRNFFPCR